MARSAGDIKAFRQESSYFLLKRFLDGFALLCNFAGGDACAPGKAHFFMKGQK